MANNKTVGGVLALLFFGTLSPAQTAAANATDPATIAGAYAENPVNADLLYKGKVLTVEGVVTAISSNSARRGAAREREEVGSAAFASLSDVKKRFGGRAALEGVVSATNVAIWHCSFDASRVEELAQLRKNDMVILEGELERYSSFRHCRVVTKEVWPPTPPHATYAPDPGYTSQATKAKLQGTVQLSLIVGTDGRAHDIRVERSLGMGLDESAIETVKTWIFDPATEDGKPVAKPINIVVTFRLYEGERHCTGYDKHLNPIAVPCPPSR